jgi:hypothetical protein
MTPHVHKKITINTLQQGAAVHGALSMHFIVDAGLQQINPELLKLYTQAASGALLGHWFMDYSGMAQAGEFDPSTAKAAEEKIVFEEGAGGQEEPHVEAAGLCFPLLCHELTKGVMELLTMDYLSEYSEPELKAIYDKSESLVDEFWEVQAGSELWKRLLATLPTGTQISDVVHALSKLPPDELHILLSEVIRGLPVAKQRLKDIVEQGEQQEEPYQDTVQEDPEEEQPL